MSVIEQAEHIIEEMSMADEIERKNQELRDMKADGASNDDIAKKIFEDLK